MNAVQLAVNSIRQKIPLPILNYVFLKRDEFFRTQPISIEQRIKDDVIYPIVMVDCDLVYGTTIFVPLNQCERENINTYTCVYQIPKSLTQNRTITSALNITFYDPLTTNAHSTGAYVGGASVINSANAIVDAQAGIGKISTARVQIIGENRVVVKDISSIPSNIYLRCSIANDDQMSHIQPRSILHFKNLVTLAVKAFIYQKIVIDVDEGYLKGGAEIGRFKDVLDTYADSEELYQTYLVEKWQKVAFMNDHEAYHRFLKSMIDGYR